MKFFSHSFLSILFQNEEVVKLEFDKDDDDGAPVNPVGKNERFLAIKYYYYF